MLIKKLRGWEWINVTLKSYDYISAVCCYAYMEDTNGNSSVVGCVCIIFISASIVQNSK